MSDPDNTSSINAYSYSFALYPKNHQPSYAYTNTNIKLEPSDNSSATISNPKSNTKSSKKTKSNTKTNSKVDNSSAKIEDTLSEQDTYYALREKDISQLEAFGLSGYPHKFDPNINNYPNGKSYIYTPITIVNFLQKYAHLSNGEVLDTPESHVSFIGRVYLIRRASKNLIFIDLHQEGSKVQIMVNAKMYLNGTDHYNLVTTVMRVGDFIGICGVPTRTKTDELSLVPHVLQIVSICKALLPPRTYKDEKTGEEVSGLCNQEIRFRQRYLDLIINEDNIKTFQTRAKIIREFRNYLDNELNLLEVDTPILNPSVGGAVAKPFESYSHDYKCPLFMRIAPELCLKMLIIGGFTGVYEIGKQFRNESNDHTHNSEFTSLEFYIQNRDFNDLMNICEHMMSVIVQNVKGSLQIEYSGKIVDFTPPFKRLDMLSTLEKEASITLPQDLTTDEARDFLDNVCTTHGVDCSNPRTTPRLLDKLVGYFVEPLCVNPTFITGHPQIMSPLAKSDRFGSCRTERFELFINSTEYANAYTELNDPKIQLENFKAQAKDKDMGDEESMNIDYNYVRALEYGLPPTAGFGLGIDRFVMLLTNNENIREVLFFPTMKPVSQIQNSKHAQ
jgi:lysyl-tRNA synthetase, class II